MPNLEKLKLANITENQDFWISLDTHRSHSTKCEVLKKKLNEQASPSDELIKEINLVRETLYSSTKYLLEKYGISVSGIGEKIKWESVNHPVSCFSFPSRWMDYKTQNLIHLVEDLLFHQLGESALTDENKDHFISDGKYLLLKIDLTFNKKDINAAVDDIVQKVQKLIGKGHHAARLQFRQLFDKIFTKQIISMPLLKALGETARIMDESHDIPIETDALLRTYYPDWRKRMGITIDIRKWKKQQKKEE